MTDNINDRDHSNEDTVSRRKMLKCMAAWSGTGIIWTIGAGGFLTACGDLTTAPATTNSPLALQTNTTAPASTTPTLGVATTVGGTAATAPTVATIPGGVAGSFTFVQVSDTHIGFSADGINTDPGATLGQVVAKINALPQRPDFVLHTGDVSQLSKAGEFDTAFQLMGGIKTPNTFYVPGEHDVMNDKGAGFRQRFLGKTSANSWYSMDIKGTHFIGLSNSGELDDFGMLGTEQLNWLQKDLAPLKKDTPVVVFAHVPLFTVYKPWAWETKDAAQAIALLKPFSAVTVLNGHIHQVVTQVEGNINFYTANSTAFPQHRPGVEKPNAYTLPASELLQNLGYRTVTLIPNAAAPTISDPTLAGTPASIMTIEASSNAASTPAGAVAVNTAAANPGFIDVGAESDFAGATQNPRTITLPPPAGKTGNQTAFILKQDNGYVGISDICTHMGCEVSWVSKDSLFECPCHGSHYDITGKNVAGPAPRPLARYKTEVVNGRLLVSFEPQPNG